MKDKILLLGELKEHTLCAEEFLLTKYRVQRCSMVQENVEGMIKIMSPDIVVACQLGEDSNNQNIFKWLREQHPEIPILFICSEKEWREKKKFYEWDEWQTLFTPLEQGELILKTSYMIDVARRECEEKKRILVVDDNSIVLRNIRQILKDKYEVVLAKSGKQAVKTVVAQEVNLLLLDYEMPDMNGEETFKRIKNIKKARKIPVIFLTGVSEREKIVKALKLSPAGYVLKPVKQNKLLQVVEEVLDENRPTEGINIEELLLIYGESEQDENSSEVEI